MMTSKGTKWGKVFVDDHFAGIIEEREGLLSRKGGC